MSVTDVCTYPSSACTNSRRAFSSRLSSHTPAGLLGMVYGMLLTAGLSAKDPDLKRFEKDISRVEEQNKAKPPPAGAILFTGSSSIARWGDVAKYFPDQAVVNRGFGGSTIPEVNY